MQEPPKHSLYSLGATYSRRTLLDFEYTYSCRYAPEAGAARFEEEFGKQLPKDFFKDQIEGSTALFRKRLQHQAPRPRDKVWTLCKAGGTEEQWVRESFGAQKQCSMTF